MGKPCYPRSGSRLVAKDQADLAGTSFLFLLVVADVFVVVVLARDVKICHIVASFGLSDIEAQLSSIRAIWWL